ncbi:hypothetical protein ACYSNR_02695 [Enterococcus sp. LJL128]
MNLDEKLKTRRYVQVDLYGMKSWMWLENPPYISADDYKVNEAYREWAEKEFDLYGREIKRGNDIDQMSRLAIELREGVDYDTGRPLTDVEKAQRWSIVLSSIAQVSIAAYYAGHPLTADDVVLKDKGTVNTKTDFGAENPVSGNDWNNYFKEQYGIDNVRWKNPVTIDEIFDTPSFLLGKKS